MLGPLPPGQQFAPPPKSPVPPPAPAPRSPRLPPGNMEISSNTSSPTVKKEIVFPQKNVSATEKQEASFTVRAPVVPENDLRAASDTKGNVTQKSSELRNSGSPSKSRNENEIVRSEHNGAGKQGLPDKQSNMNGSGLDLSNRNDHGGSAFELYQKQAQGDAVQINGSASVGDESDQHQPLEHTVVAHVSGVIGAEGGNLTSPETGVSIHIPKGALPANSQQEIYFKVCRDTRMAPPLDTEKGETLLSPLVMCGPQGLKFEKAVELRLPHCASGVNSEQWSFALKSASGSEAEWKQVTLADTENENQQQGRLDEKFVSVMIDHF